MNQAVLESKKNVVTEISDKFKKSSSTVVAEYRGLSVAEVTELRRALRAEGVDMKVYKNTLAARAAEDAGFADLKEITEVYSHPEALSQCQIFFREHPSIRTIAYQDTAKSVQYVKECNVHDKAALGSERAAEYYGMESLISSVQDSNSNITRFLWITNKKRIQ